MYYICSKGINDFAGRYQSYYQSEQATSHFWGLRWHLIFIELILYKSSIRLKLVCLYCLYIQFVQWIVMYNADRISWGWLDLVGATHGQRFQRYSSVQIWKWYFFDSLICGCVNKMPMGQSMNNSFSYYHMFCYGSVVYCLCFSCAWLNLNLSCTYVCLLPPWQMVESKLHMRWFRFCSFGELLAAQAVSPVRYLCCFSRFPWYVITSVLSALIPEEKTVTWFGWSLGIIGGLLELLHVVMSV